MEFTSEQRLDDGVLEREFTLGEIPGILWTPGSAPAPAPLRQPDFRPAVLVFQPEGEVAGGRVPFQDVTIGAAAKLLDSLGYRTILRSQAGFVPPDQAPKLKLIAQAAKVLGPALNPDSIDAPPSDQENIDSLKSAAENLRKTAGDAKGADGKGPGATAARR